MTGSFCLALEVSMETAWETEKAALSLSVMPSDKTAHRFIHAIESRCITSDKPSQRRKEFNLVTLRISCLPPFEIKILIKTSPKHFSQEPLFKWCFSNQKPNEETWSTWSSTAKFLKLYDAKLTVAEEIILKSMYNSIISDLSQARNTVLSVYYTQLNQVASLISFLPLYV